MLTQKPKKRGQTLIEYLILVSLVAVGSMAVIQVLSSNLNRKLGSVANALSGNSSKKIEGVSVTEDHYKIRDLGDFSDASVDNER